MLLKNRSGRTLRGTVSDDPIGEATTTALPAPFLLLPHASVTIEYEITPTRRGPRDLGAVTVRYSSALGLMARQERTELPARVDVYPDVHAARSLEMLRRQGRQDARLGSLRVRGGEAEAFGLLGAVRVFTLAESLGGVESLIEHPATMTHASLPAGIQRQMGITPDLIRISVGIEDVADLIADLDQALGGGSV